jgi:phage gp36-like protein
MPETFYCEVEDLKGVGVSEQKLIHLTNGTDSINQEIFDSARRSATAQVNGFAMNRYSAKYYLYPMSSVPEEIQKAYDNQITLLKMLSNGTFKLEQDDTPVQEDSVQFTNKKPENRFFHLTNMPGYLP